jgi:phage shock protein B
MFALFILVPLLVLAGIVALVARLFRGSLSRRQPPEMEDETRMIQEIYTKLSRMEERVDVLETLLLEESRREREDGHGQA